MLLRVVTFTALLNAGLAFPSTLAGETPEPVATDFNIITAIDVSDSITRHDEWLQYSGLARGVVDPDFLTLIEAGPLKRIGFKAFTWSSGGRISVVVPWTVITGPEQAERVAAQLVASPRIDRSHYDGNHQVPDAVHKAAYSSSHGMTDIAQAIAAADGLARSAPLQGRRTVINILSNGVDNSGTEPGRQRDEAIRLGATINGVVFGSRSDVPDYFRRNVIGGPGAFLMTVQDPNGLPEALARKFWHDLVAHYKAPQVEVGGVSLWQ